MALAITLCTDNFLVLYKWCPCSHSSTKHDAFLPANHSSSVFHSLVDSAQVELALSGLDSHKATIDIPNYLIKIACNLLSTPFTNLVNESIESGIVPHIFKISKVTPVFKTGAVTDPGNYHPNAVLPPFAKILERLVYNQLNVYQRKHCELDLETSHGRS